jgi:hypothetical protein
MQLTSLGVFFMASYPKSSQLLDQKMAMNGNAGKDRKDEDSDAGGQRYGMPLGSAAAG